MKRKGLAVGIILLFVGTCIIPAIAQDIEKPSLLTSSGNWLYVGGSGLGNFSTIQSAINVVIKNECNTVGNFDTIDKKYIASKRIQSHSEYNETMNDLPIMITLLFGKIDGFYITEEDGWTFFIVNATSLYVTYMLRISLYRYSYESYYFTFPIWFGFYGGNTKNRGIWKDNFICGFISTNW